MPPIGGTQNTGALEPVGWIGTRHDPARRCGPGFEHPTLDFVRDALNRWMLEQHRGGKLDLQSFPDLGQDDHRGERGAAELEKIVLQADAFPAERSRPDLCYGGLGRARRLQRRAADDSSLAEGPCGSLFHWPSAAGHRASPISPAPCSSAAFVAGRRSIRRPAQRRQRRTRPAASAPSVRPPRRPAPPSPRDGAPASPRSLPARSDSPAPSPGCLRAR